MRSSWHLDPMLGIGRERGIESRSPRCSLRSKNPASSRAAAEKGGDLTSPCNHASGLCFALRSDSICQNRHTVKRPSSSALHTDAPGLSRPLQCGKDRASLRRAGKRER
jgi:hypothetical protein